MASKQSRHYLKLRQEDLLGNGSGLGRARQAVAVVNVRKKAERDALILAAMKQALEQYEVK